MAKVSLSLLVIILNVKLLSLPSKYRLAEGIKSPQTHDPIMCCPQETLVGLKINRLKVKRWEKTFYTDSTDIQDRLLS